MCSTKKKCIQIYDAESEQWAYIRWCYLYTRKLWSTLDHCQSCQVRMVQSLEVVRAFSAKKNFPERIFSDDLSPHPPPPSPKKFRSVYHFRGKNIFGKDTFPKFDLFLKNFNEYCTTTFLVFLIHTLETSTDFLSKKKTIFSEIEFLWESVRFSQPTVRPGVQRENLETHG
jgi:hypothetical protein